MKKKRHEYFSYVYIKKNKCKVVNSLGKEQDQILWHSISGPVYKRNIENTGQDMIFNANTITLSFT